MSARRLTFFRLVVRGAGPLTWACVTAILSAGLSVAPFWFLCKIVGVLLAPNADLDAVWRFGRYALLTLALRWALMAVSHVLAHRGAFAVQHRLRLDMARRLGEVPMSFFSRRGSGSLRRTLTDDVNNLEGFLAHMLPDMVASATVPIAALALLLAVDWRLTLAALVPLPVAIAVQTVLMRRAALRMREWSELQRKIADQVGEYVRGIAVVKAFGREASSFGALASAIRGAVAWVEDYARSSAGGWVVFTALLCANVVTVAPAGAWLYWRGALDLPTYVLFLLVAPSVLLPLLRLTFSLGEQLQRAESLARINEVLGAPVLADAPKVSLPQGPLSLSFIDVRHRYDDTHARYALDGVSFSAEAGTLTALVGASGSGKSTLARLLPRLYEYESGRVCVGAVDVRDWPLDALLSRIGIVFQDVFLFHGTVADNLRIAAPGASMQALESAARAARAHDFITALPQGYDTPIGERGATLSGGERQRLSIARALLKNAPILLLDEATASIDAENEVAIQSALQTLCKGRTVLMIAHRLRTIMHADRIVVLDAGRVAGIGRHDALLKDCAAYRRLWNDHEAARDWALDVRAGVAREDVLKERHA